MVLMFEAEVLEFPFAASLPKREKSRLQKCWELLGRMNEISETEGNLIPLMLGAKCLGISRTRVDQLVADGRLKRVDIDGHVFLTENSIVECAKVERKEGRPPKLFEEGVTFKGCIQLAKEIRQELREGSSKKS